MITYSTALWNACHTGRTSNARSPGFKNIRSVTSSSWHKIFPWLSITPFGVPVVPLVKIIVARSSGFPFSSSCSTASGCCLRHSCPDFCKSLNQRQATFCFSQSDFVSSETSSNEIIVLSVGIDFFIFKSFFTCVSFSTIVISTSEKERM